MIMTILIQKFNLDSNASCIDILLGSFYFGVFKDVFLPNGLDQKGGLVHTLPECQQIIIRIQQGKFLLPPGFDGKMAVRMYWNIFVKESLI